MDELNILAVIVLYKRTPQASESFMSLQRVLLDRPDLKHALTLMVYDNSPSAQTLPSFPIPTLYISDTGNGGLVPAYNAALQMAEEGRAKWLLLLDQDTVLTEAYVTELVSILPGLEPAVSAVIPKLVQSGTDKVISPHYIPRLTHKGVDIGCAGKVNREISAINSAAILRVSAVRAFGGFPTEHPIEFLDHTVFYLLQQTGSKIWIMQSKLSHKLSVSELGKEMSLSRYKNVLYAERDFYKYHRGISDRTWYRFRKLKQVVGHLWKVKDKQFAMWDLRAALGMLGRGV